MDKFYRQYRHDGRMPTIHPSQKYNWDITARAESAKVEVLRLGVQSNAPIVLRESHWKALSWSPKWAKSYSILSFQHTDYYDLSEDHPTGYACFSVIYYSRKNEGRFVVTEYKPVSWDNFRIVPTCDPSINLNILS